MSQAELYQSILLKLGHLPSASLSEVDAFLSELASKKSTRPSSQKRYKARLARIAGAWKDWDEQEFKSFLDTTHQIRQELFNDREVSI